MTTSSSSDITKRPWWQNAVVYQIYPRSFCDSNGDGIGDLPGLISKLDYLRWLGIDAVWLNPINPSPNADWGYDVADYCDVHPDLGTLADLDLLVAEAGSRGIRVILDLVPNHSSDRHPWFYDPARRDFYVWAASPTNWRSVFGGPAWTRGEHGHYLHTFLPEQPELNWWNEAVRSEFDDVLRFWFERGIGGFRIDVAHRLVEKRPFHDLRGRVRFPPVDLPETHAVIKRWRAHADTFEPDRMLVGETYVHEVSEMAEFYGSGHDELHLAFNFPFVHAPLRAPALRRVVEETEAALPPGAWPAWTASNHDAGRLASRWCKGDAELARCALLVLLMLRGTPFLYYGDEIGLLEVPVPKTRQRDHAGKPSRDPGRTPMPWSNEPGAGFTDPGVEPWLPLGSLDRNIADQRRDPGSILAFCRETIALRGREPELCTGTYETVDAGPGVWAWRRAREFAVAVNLSRRRRRIPLTGETVLATRREREGESGPLELGPSEGAVVHLERPLGHPGD